jgi:hypothetical protein
MLMRHAIQATETLEHDRPRKCAPGSMAHSPADTTYDVDDEDLEYCDELDGRDISISDAYRALAVPREYSTIVGDIDDFNSPSAESKGPFTGGLLALQFTSHRHAHGLTSSATFFYQDGIPGACGKVRWLHSPPLPSLTAFYYCKVHKDSEFIAAIDERRYGNPGQRSQLCGRQVRVTNLKNKKVGDGCCI